MIGTVYNRAVDLLGAISAGSILALTFGVTLDVVLRVLQLAPLEWMLEASEYALLLITYLAAPWALREGAHVRVDVVVASLPRPVARLLDMVADLLGMAVSAALLVWGMKALLASKAMGSIIFKVMVFPEWWLYLPLVVASPFLFVEFVLRFGRAWRGEVAQATEATGL